MNTLDARLLINPRPHDIFRIRSRLLQPQHAEHQRHARRHRHDQRRLRRSDATLTNRVEHQRIAQSIDLLDMMKMELKENKRWTIRVLSVAWRPRRPNDRFRATCDGDDGRRAGRRDDLHDSMELSMTTVTFSFTDTDHVRHVVHVHRR